VYPVVDAIDQRWRGQDWITVMSAHPAFTGDGAEKPAGYGHAGQLTG
jgi:hypothetical protein